MVPQFPKRHHFNNLLQNRTPEPWKGHKIAKLCIHLQSRRRECVGLWWHKLSETPPSGRNRIKANGKIYDEPLYSAGRLCVCDDAMDRVAKINGINCVFYSSFMTPLVLACQLQHGVRFLWSRRWFVWFGWRSDSWWVNWARLQTVNSSYWW